MSFGGISDFNKSLITEIETNLSFNKTVKGNTQESEREFIKIVNDSLVKLSGHTVEQAPSQQAIDFRNVHVGDQLINYECKKVNTGNKFIFNDTVIKPDVYYILNYVGLKKILIKKGSDIELLSEKTITSIIKEDLEFLKQIVFQVETIDLLFIKQLFGITISLAKNAVHERIINLFEYGELFKFSTNFGNAKSRPRPNWTFTIDP
jgi:hypothetical protein